MAANQDIEDVVFDIIRTDLAVDVPVIDQSSRLITDLALDSMAFAIALLAIEERLGVEISQEELMGCQTIEDVVDVVAQRASAPSLIGGSAQR